MTEWTKNGLRQGEYFVMHRLILVGTGIVFLVICEVIGLCL
jgi:hypothetical protein